MEFTQEIKFGLLALCSICFIICQTESKPDKPREIKLADLQGKLFGGSDGSRAINGGNSKLKEFPWHLSYRYRNPENKTDTHVCGGTLLNATHFVTAAHCAKPTDVGAFAEFGTLNIKNRTEGEHQKQYELKKIWSHPFYDKEFLAADVSVVELAEPVTFTKHIQPLRLAPPDANPLGQLCTAIGWGRTLRNHSEGYYGEAEVLQKVELKVISTEDCKPRVGYVLLHGMFCATSPDNKHRGICQGDSGGSLICYDKDGPYLAGITSWSNPKDCGNPDEANGFARVTDFLDYIKYNIAEPIEIVLYNTTKNWGK